MTKLAKAERQRPGEAPTYQMETGFGPVQPTIVVDDRVYCPGEGWRRISSGIGYYAVICPGTKLMHTAYPDPVTSRRMRAAFYRRRDA